MYLGILASHPVQYQAPWFRTLAQQVDLEVFFAHRQTPKGQADGGFGIAFDWDIDLLSGYKHRFLNNVSRRPGTGHFFGCDTPEIANIIGKAESRNQPGEVRTDFTGQGKQKAERELQTTGLRDCGTTGPEEEGEVSGQPSEVEGRLHGPRRSVVSGQSSRGLSSAPFDAFIISGWQLKCYWQAVRACRRARVPVLVRGDSQLGTPRSPLKRIAKEILYRLLLRQFDGFLVVGQRNREYLKHYAVKDQRMFFAPHFVDNEWFVRRAEEVRCQRSEVRKGWGIPEDAFCVLFCGKFIPKKRPLDLVAAVRLLSASISHLPSPISAYPAIHLLFVGSGELGDQLRKSCHVVFDAEKPVVSSPLPPSPISHLPSATFAGFKNQSELPACYVAADCLVLPSDGGETWGLVVNEAMACGLPAIVSDAAGCAPDLIDEGETGFTFPVGDTTQLAGRLAVLLEMKQRGHDFGPTLAEKTQIYSVESAVNGTLKAVDALARR